MEKVTSSQDRVDETKSLRSTSVKSKEAVSDIEKPFPLPDTDVDDKSASLFTVKSTEVICGTLDCFQFKRITDPGLLQAYVIGAGMEIKTESDEEIYLRLVKEADISPIKRIMNSLQGSSVKLEHYGLDPRQIKPLTEALLNNKTVEELNLKCNVLSTDALYHLGQMFLKNTCLKKLNLQHCKIGPEGADMLGNALDMCRHLEELDLSHNEIGDSGMEALRTNLTYNTSIRRLDLSHNNLTHQSGFYLADVMAENIQLQHLDLSWNQIAEEPGLKAFLTSAADTNEALLSLNLSWNNLGGDRIANIIKNFIGQHKAIKELNLSHNCFGSPSENIKIAKGINTSESLNTLNLSYNGLTPDSAFALLQNISTKAKLKSLLLNNVWVKPECFELSRGLLRSANLKVVVEGVTGGHQVKGPDMQSLLLMRARFLGYKPKKNKKDFGWFLLRLQKAGTLAPVKKSKFETLVQEDKIQFDEGMIDEFVKRFKNEEKKVDLNLMLEKYLEIFPDTALPVPKEKKKKKASIDIKTSPKGSRKDSKENLEQKDSKGSRKGSEDRKASETSRRGSKQRKASKASRKGSKERKASQGSRKGSKERKASQGSMEGSEVRKQTLSSRGSKKEFTVTDLDTTPKRRGTDNIVRESKTKEILTGERLGNIVDGTSRPSKDSGKSQKEGISTSKNIHNEVEANKESDNLS